VRWLAWGQGPDFQTLNDFRGKLLTGVMEDIFVTAVKRFPIPPSDKHIWVRILF
jgi:hypothetical protein